MNFTNHPAEWALIPSACSVMGPQRSRTIRPALNEVARILRSLAIASSALANQAKRMVAHLGHASALRVLPLLLLLSLPAAVQGQFTYVTNNGTITITGYTGPGGDVTIPSTIDGLTVTSIGISAFESNSRINSVTVPDSVVNIGESAFSSCTVGKPSRPVLPTALAVTRCAISQPSLLPESNSKN